MIFNKIISKIDNGRDGGNKGIYMGYQRLYEYIPGIQKATYYLVGGETSSGKSAFVDSSFVYNPYDYVINNDSGIKLKIIYFSLEIEKEIKITKAISRKIYFDYGCITDVNFILSRGKNRISQEIYDAVLKQKDYFCKMEDVLTMIDTNVNPTAIWSYLSKYSQENGEWVVSEDGYTRNYIEKDEKLYTIIVIDHASLMKKERGFSTKENIDELSGYLITLRNKCKFIPVVVSQFNRSISSADRFKIDMVLPQLSDFKYTSNISEDANVIMALFSPARYDIPEFRGYDIAALRNNFRSLSILKNRDGEADKILGLHFIGEIGHFEELPPAKEMNISDYENILNTYKKKVKNYE